MDDTSLEMPIQHLAWLFTYLEAFLDMFCSFKHALAWLIREAFKDDTRRSGASN